MIVWHSFSTLFYLVPRAFALIIIGPFVAIVADALWEVVVLLFIFGPLVHHVAEFCNCYGSLMAEISEDVAAEEALMVAVADVLLGDVGDGGVFLKETLHIFSQGLIPSLFTLRQIMMSTYANHDAFEVVDEESTESPQGVDDVFWEGVQPQELCGL